MKGLSFFCCGLLVLQGGQVHGQELLDRVDEALSVSVFDQKVRARLSGLIDLESYHYDRPAPGLIDSTSDTLFNPRLSLFFDAQVGPRVYAFVQARLDRGFDPSDHGAEVRLDEYALRATPWDDGRLSIQIGKFSTVVGNWQERHLSWDNPFVTAPLPYEHMVAIYDAEAPASAHEFLDPTLETKYEYAPVIWGPTYATGATVAGRFGRWDYAAEVKNAGLSSRPSSWDATEVGFDHPTLGGRIGWRPNEMWTVGLSASRGAYFRPEAKPTLPRGRGLGDYNEQVLGQDVRFQWHHWQLWAEVYEARFAVPRIGNADSLAYYVEAKLKVIPQLYGAVRWNQQFFGTVPNGVNVDTRWGQDLWRIDAALGYRLTAHAQLKLEESLQRQRPDLHDFTNLIAAQFTLRF